LILPHVILNNHDKKSFDTMGRHHHNPPADLLADIPEITEIKRKTI
jgi:hypothetical protein